MKLAMKSIRIGVAPVVIAAFIVGCDGGREGERCNPNLSHDECSEGLSCQRPATCAENYCCPTPYASSANPFCNGVGCPAAGNAAADAGAD